MTMKDDDGTTVSALKGLAASFTSERDWEQFHNPKDLSMAISCEAAELMELFLWKDAGTEQVREDDELMERVRQELSDVLILSMCLANALDIDVSSSFADKMELNRRRYPADKVRGMADKYDRYE